MAKDDDILDEARDLFRQCEEREADNRDEALDDLEFARLARQWRPEDEEQRAAEGRPCLTINRMPAFIRQVVNDARQNAPAIAVRAVDDAADPATAEVMSDLIRDIEAQSSADIAYDTAVDFAVSCGFGYFRINTAYTADDAFDQDIRIARIANPFSVYGDPFSDAPDSSDWNVAFVLDRMTRAQFERRFKGADLVSWADPRWDNMDEPWKAEGDHVGVAEYWLREEVKKPIIALSNGMIVAVKEFEANKALFDAQGVGVIGSPRDVISHKVTQRLISGCDVLQTTEWAVALADKTAFLVLSQHPHHARRRIDLGNQVHRYPPAMTDRPVQIVPEMKRSKHRLRAPASSIRARAMTQRTSLTPARRWMWRAPMSPTTWRGPISG